MSLESQIQIVSEELHTEPVVTLPLDVSCLDLSCHFTILQRTQSLICFLLSQTLLLL